MPTTTSTTTVHRSELSVPADLLDLDEALALAQRVNHKIRTPLPVSPPSDECEYEPQSWIMGPSPTNVRRTG